MDFRLSFIRFDVLQLSAAGRKDLWFLSLRHRGGISRWLRSCRAASVMGPSLGTSLWYRNGCRSGASDPVGVPVPPTEICELMDFHQSADPPLV
ncbi:hypothetical protein EYF80_041151 [Liparis tanakae]|uniref:Uncharacterized protein n=1 Tax=Liparis tanakae TaxID=230148 RepID=A0A4Z2G535_9TELE|nr:hypothetical protein EYF80_041151 [Liparis tanakae]